MVSELQAPESGDADVIPAEDHIVVYAHNLILIVLAGYPFTSHDGWLCI